VAEQNPVWNKTWQYSLLRKKENNSAEKKGFLYASLPPTSCQKLKENGNTMILVYTLSAAWKKINDDII